MRFDVYCRRSGFAREWVWDYDEISPAQACVEELLGQGYDEAWVEPSSNTEALAILETEVASLRGRLKFRNRQIRDLRKELRKKS